MEKQEIKKIKKRNVRIYPVYKMFSWDLLFYYAIAFVFQVSVKGFSPAEVMLTDGLYPAFRIMLNIPCTYIIDKIGKRRALIIANFSLVLYLVALMCVNSLLSLVFVYVLMAFAFTIKVIAESNLLYESVPHQKEAGRRIFYKIEEKGIRNYYYLDGIASLSTGLLFLINGYLPMIVSAIFAMIATLLTFRFKEIETKEKVKTKLIDKIKSYKKEMKASFKFVFKSKRLKALLLFTLAFEGLVYTSYTLRESILSQLNVPPHLISLIVAVLVIISGIFVFLEKVLRRKFKNRALTVIISVYIPTFLLVGIISILNVNSTLKLWLIILMFIFQYAMQAPYFTLFAGYIRNFTESDMRNKISGAYDLARGTSQVVVALSVSWMLTQFSATRCSVIIGGIFLVLIYIVLAYMKTRFGLKPEEYDKDDIL